VAPLAGWAEQKSTLHVRRGILLVYRAEPVAGELTPHDDVSAARWFWSEEIPWDELAFESTARFLKGWVASL
jgi:ADP-ribose pyrophosphatase YjhB (NUDIX family)